MQNQKPGLAREAPDKNKKKKQKKREKKKKKLYLYALIVLFLGITIFVMFFFLLFYTQRIEVTGTNYSSPEEVKAWIKQDKLSSNTLYVLYKYKNSKFKKLPFMEDVHISLKAPWVIGAKVEEKKIIACILVGSEYVYFDKEGYVVLKDAELRENIPYIEGLDVDKAPLYKNLSIKNKKVLKNILKVTKSLKKQKLAPDRIECSESDINIYIGNVCVKLGDNNFDMKISQIQPIIDKLGGVGGTLKLEHYGEGTEVISFVKGDVSEGTDENAGESAQNADNTDDVQSFDEGQASTSADEQKEAVQNE